MIEIIIIAAIVVVVLFLIFFIQDRKKRKEDKEVQEEGFTNVHSEPTHMAKAKDNTVIDYNVYKMTIKEYIFYALIACTFLFGLGFIFYQSIIMSSILAMAGLFYPKMQKQKLLEKRKDELGKQFQQALFSLSSSLVAGRSIENAFVEVTRDLRLLYPDSETYIIKEFELINKKVANRVTIEKAIEDFSKRAGIDDITNFTDVFATCKRTGGDLVEVIRRTSTMISEKIEIQQEISVMVAQKRFEARALSIAPIIIIAFLGFSSSEYMSPLYSWADFGPVVMTICLGILIFSNWVSQRIMDIKV